jgi:putative tryptophan/tyrosine transport system substrate-binding protein
MNDPQPEGHMASRIGRRKFLATLGGATAWPLAARAQQGERMRRIGVLMAMTAGDPESAPPLAAFAQGLQQSGWTIGQNVRVDYRWGGGNADNMRTTRRNWSRSPPTSS